MRYFLLIIVLATTLGCTATRMSSSRTATVAKMADVLVKIDTVSTLNDATMRHVRLISRKPPRLVLNDPANSDYPRTGEWISAEQQSAFPFTQMIPSWNVKTPEGTSVRFFVKVRDKAHGAWSPWLYVGYWGKPSPEDEVTEFAGGHVDIDTVKLSRPADAWQIRAVMESLQTDVKINPSIRRISVTYSGMVKDTAILKKIYGPSTRPATQQSAIDLPVPYRAQGDTTPAMWGQTCSPTSVSMVLAYWGKDFPTTTNCRAIWDEEYHLFGNWNRAVGRAGELGLDAWVTHIRNWQEARDMLAKGQPIIAAIKFKPGEFPSSVLKSTNGHLIVIRGMTANGDLICNDPGKRGVGDHVIYKANELGHAWFTGGGVAYIIHGHHPVGKSSVDTAK